MNRLAGGGGGPGVGGFEGGEDTDGEGECEGASGRVVRAIGGGTPCDLPLEFEGKLFDRGGGGGRGGLDLESVFLEGLFYTRYPSSDRHVIRNIKLEGGEKGNAHLISIFSTVEFVRCRIFRLESLTLDVSKRRHRSYRLPLSDIDHSGFR